jgi:putative ABC transport system permease protein
MSPGQRVFRSLLRLLPGEFRGDFGDAMTVDLAHTSGPAPHWWTREIPGLLAAIVREHLDVLRQDIKYALRMMRRTPGFTLTAIMMLALGTGVNVAMFSVVDAVALRSPFVDRRQLVIVQAADDKGNFSSAVPPEQFRALARPGGPLESVGALDGLTATLTGVAEPRRLSLHCVTPSMFTTLGTPALIGRAFDESDARVGTAPVIVISFPMWQSLGGDTSIVGSVLQINGARTTVIGVMPKTYGGAFSNRDMDGWVPLDINSSDRSTLGCQTGMFVNAFGRLRGPSTPASAERQLPGIHLISLSAQAVSEWQTPFRMLTGAVVCVLLIACGNVGGLQLERAMARRRELAVRAALGASRARLIRQWLTEGLTLACAGGVAGVMAAALCLRLLIAAMPTAVPHAADIAINGRVLVAALIIAGVAGLLSSCVPLLHTTSLLHKAAGTATTRATAHTASWTRRILMSAEVALSVALVIGAILMVRSFLTLRPSNPGFEYRDKLMTVVRLPPPLAAAPERPFADLVDRVKTIPGVRAVTASSFVPMSGTVVSRRVALDSAPVTAFAAWALPDYFSVMHMRIAAGRSFLETDRPGTVPVAMVNQALAARLRSDGNVLGARISVAGRSTPAVERVIVGIVSNTRSGGHTTASDPELYIPFAQEPVSQLNLFIETTGTATLDATTAIHAAIRDAIPGALMEPVRPLAATVNRTVADRELGAWLLGLFAAMAVALSLVGLVTTLGWWLSQRQKEIGVRVALGATSGQIRALVLRQGLAIGGAGIVVGLALAVAGTRFLTSWLYGVTSLDLATFAGAAAAMLIATVAAIALPTRRATRINPVTALRAE